MNESPQNFKEFCQSINDFIRDETYPKKNIKTDLFLHGMQNWLIDTEGGRGFFDTPNETGITWSDLIKLIQASAIYE